MDWFPIARARATLSWLARFRRRYAAIHVDDDPETTSPYSVYVVGEDGHHWYVAFGCPCGCGETIKLSVIPGDRPGWQVREHWSGTVSLSPSVWRQVGCKSHFWLRKGKVRWC